jgi:hypothetical protein
MCNSACFRSCQEKELKREIKVKKFDHFQMTGERPRLTLNHTKLINNFEK